jgi:hypothetical protein
VALLKSSPTWNKRNDHIGTLLSNRISRTSGDCGQPILKIKLTFIENHLIIVRMVKVIKAQFRRGSRVQFPRNQFGLI